MPRGNGTGPMGMGPMAGRRAGYCAGFGVPGYMNPTAGGLYGQYFGRGRGFGGGGYGRRNRFFATGAPGWMRFGWDAMPPGQGQRPISEKDILQGQAEFLQSQLDDIKEQLVALAKEKSE